MENKENSWETKKIERKQKENRWAGKRKTTGNDENECETSLCKVELEINVKSRPGGVFGQYVEDAGMSWFTVGLIFILIISSIMLIAIRRRRHGMSGDENWDSEFPTNSDY